MPDIVLQRGFAVVDVSHEAYDWYFAASSGKLVRFFGCRQLRLVRPRTPLFLHARTTDNRISQIFRLLLIPLDLRNRREDAS